MKIYLIAAHLLMEFVDLDEKIEAREQKSIPEIFSQHGEPYFRQVESALLHEWAASPKSFVMATGGGAPCFFEGIKAINDTGISIFLDESVEELVRRTEKKSGRPLLQTTDETELRNRLTTIRQNRLPIYQEAKIVLQRPDLHSVLKALKFEH